MFSDSTSADSLSPSVLWKTSLECPGKYGMGAPAADPLSGLCVVCVGTDRTGSEVDFIAVRITDGQLLSTMPDPPEVYSEDVWVVDKSFMLEGENVIVMLSDPGNEVHVEVGPVSFGTIYDPSHNRKSSFHIVS
jgi:hypothetical protein